MFYFQMMALPQWALGLTLFFQAATNPGLLPETTVSEPAPPQQTAKSFEWATVWTSQAVEGNSAKTPTGTWYSRARLDDLADRLAVFSAMTGKNARKICVPLSEADDLLSDLGNTLTFTEMSPEQKAFLGLVSLTKASPTGQIILGDQLPSDIILCGTENSPRLGTYYPEYRIIAVEFRNACRGTDFLPVPFGFYPSENFGLSLFAFMEEATHAWQNVARDIFLPKNFETSWAADVKLWNLALEAHAKLISSVMMVEYFLNGGQADVAKAIEENTPEAALLNAVMNVYLEHGKKTVEKNPSLLLPVFLSFFEDPVFMQGYFDQGAEFINEINGTHRIPFREFQDAFGKLPGMKGNMFSGVSQKERSLNAVIAHIAPGTEVRQWFDEQIAARAEGRQGPPIPVPQEEEEDCTAPPIAQLAVPSPN